MPALMVQFMQTGVSTHNT